MTMTETAIATPRSAHPPKARNESQSDRMLISRIKQGDMGAMNDLIKKYESRAYAFAHRLTKDETEAADIVADAFVKVWKSIKNFREDSKFTTWLYRIEANCFFDNIKSAHNRFNRETLELERSIVENLKNDCEDQMVASALVKDQNAALKAALLKMPKGQRITLVMYYAESMSYEEIAEAMNTPIGTVKSRLNRGRLSLRDNLKGSILEPGQ